MKYEVDNDVFLDDFPDDELFEEIVDRIRDHDNPDFYLQELKKAVKECEEILKKQKIDEKETRKDKKC